MDLESVLPYTKNLAVLYVEDSLTIRKIIEKKLSPLFSHLDVAKDGEQGLQYYANYYEKYDKYYDILITDLEMPNMDGQELSRATLDFNPSQEIIIISANEDLKKVIELVNVGIHKFVSKPIEEEQLYQVISDIAQKIRLARLKKEDQEEVEEHNFILKQREESHLKTLESFNNALDASAIISKTDINGTITYVNEKFCKISGYSKEELIGQNHRILSSGNMKEAFYTKLWNTLLAKKPHKSLFENQTKDGKPYFIETVINPIFDVNMNIIEFIAISFDMTKLMTSLRNASQAQESKENFFINMSHEMRTPLNAILGFTSILKKRLKDDPTNRDIINTIYESSTDLQHLIESILDLNKLKENTLTLDNITFNTRDTFKKCISKYREKALTKKQSFELDIDEKLPVSLIGDPLRITQLLSAVLDNAIKFTKIKGHINIKITYDVQTEVLSLSVKDDGIGMSDEEKKIIFSFQQLDGSFTRLHEGAGLGLRIATDLLKLMRGNISVESNKSEGSCFNINIPIKPQ